MSQLYRLLLFGLYNFIHSIVSSLKKAIEKWVRVEADRCGPLVLVLDAWVVHEPRRRLVLGSHALSVRKLNYVMALKRLRTNGFDGFE